MTKTIPDFDQRVNHIRGQAESLITRCQEMDAEAQQLLRDHRRVDDVNRGLFVSEMISEALSKGIDCKLAIDTAHNLGDRAAAQMATCERWITGASALLNKSRLVLDDVEDIWGRKLPTGGLWDK